MQFHLKTVPHTQMKINPDVWQRTPAAREGGELRSQFFRVPERWREGMLRGAAPVNGRAARSMAARVETVSAKEPGSSRGSGLQTGPNERPGQGRVEVFPALSHSKTNDPQRAQPLYDLPPFFRYQPTNCLTPTLFALRVAS